MGRDMPRRAITNKGKPAQQERGSPHSRSRGSAEGTRERVWLRASLGIFALLELFFSSRASGPAFLLAQRPFLLAPPAESAHQSPPPFSRCLPEKQARPPQPRPPFKEEERSPGFFCVFLSLLSACVSRESRAQLATKYAYSVGKSLLARLLDVLFRERGSTLGGPIPQS